MRNNARPETQAINRKISPKVKPGKTPENPSRSSIPKCPICKRALPCDLRDPPPPTYFPFCLQQCKLVDFHKWVSKENYTSSPMETPQDPDDLSQKK